MNFLLCPIVSIVVKKVRKWWSDGVMEWWSDEECFYKCLSPAHFRGRANIYGETFNYLRWYFEISTVIFLVINGDNWSCELSNEKWRIRRKILSMWISYGALCAPAYRQAGIVVKKVMEWWSDGEYTVQSSLCHLITSSHPHSITSSPHHYLTSSLFR